MAWHDKCAVGKGSPGSRGAEATPIEANARRSLLDRACRAPAIVAAVRWSSMRDLAARVSTRCKA